MTGTINKMNSNYLNQSTMKLLKLSIAMFALLAISFTTISCENNKKQESTSQKMEMKGDDGHDHDHEAMETSSHDEQEMTSTTTEASNEEVQQTSKSDAIVASYLQLKNALVADNSKNAAVAAESMLKAFEGFDASGYNADQQKELAEILENANEQAEHIVKNVKNMHHQREHLDVLSNDMIDFLAIVGSNKTLYQTHCPMFGKKGATWLSETKEIKNPFMGGKMLTCGSVQKEI